MKTEYSDVIEGSDENYEWPVRFDVTGYVVGITQQNHRVLLSRDQARHLRAFLNKHLPKGARRPRRTAP